MALGVMKPDLGAMVDNLQGKPPRRAGVDPPPCLAAPPRYQAAAGFCDCFFFWISPRTASRGAVSEGAYLFGMVFWKNLKEIESLTF